MGEVGWGRGVWGVGVGCLMLGRGGCVDKNTLCTSPPHPPKGEEKEKSNLLLVWLFVCIFLHLFAFVWIEGGGGVFGVSWGGGVVG